MDAEKEVVEVRLDDQGLDQLRKKLVELKETKEHIHFDDLTGKHLIVIHAKTRLL